MAVESLPSADSRSRAVAVVARGTGDVIARIDELKALTEREVLGCGDALSSLLDKARDLVAESDRNAETALARSDAITSRFVSGMQEDIHAQEAAVERVLALMNGIQEAVVAIERLTQSSHILTINIAIEAARVGEHGKGFAVIASQMRHLGNTIQTAAESVTSAINGVRAGLPPVMARAVSINERTQTFIRDISHEVELSSIQTKSSATSGGRLDAVVELSNVALSHLQFQDPLVQSLSAISADLDRLASRVARTLDGSTDALPLDSSRPAGKSGGLVLF